jgi:hypothetical protein
VEAFRVVPNLEAELPGRDEFLIGAGHPDIKRFVSVGFETRPGEAQPSGDCPDLLWWLQDVEAVFCPKVMDGRAPSRCVRFVPDRDVAVGQLPRVDVNHGFSLDVVCRVVFHGLARNPADTADSAGKTSELKEVPPEVHRQDPTVAAPLSRDRTHYPRKHRSGRPPRLCATACHHRVRSCRWRLFDATYGVAMLRAIANRAEGIDSLAP